jgi:hypothetical protein
MATSELKDQPEESHLGDSPESDNSRGHPQLNSGNWQWASASV